MRTSLKEILAREAKLSSQNSVLATLTAGTQEEINVSGDSLSLSLTLSVWFLTSYFEFCKACIVWKQQSEFYQVNLGASCVVS